MGGCPLSCADADPAHRAVGNVPVHKCITGLVRLLDPELNSRKLHFNLGNLNSSIPESQKKMRFIVVVKSIK